MSSKIVLAHLQQKQTVSIEVGTKVQTALYLQGDLPYHRRHIVRNVMGKLTILAVAASTMHVVST